MENKDYSEILRAQLNVYAKFQGRAQGTLACMAMCSIPGVKVTDWNAFNAHCEAMAKKLDAELTEELKNLK